MGRWRGGGRSVSERHWQCWLAGLTLILAITKPSPPSSVASRPAFFTLAKHKPVQRCSSARGMVWAPLGCPSVWVSLLRRSNARWASRVTAGTGHFTVMADRSLVGVGRRWLWCAAREVRCGAGQLVELMGCLLRFPTRPNFISRQLADLSMPRMGRGPSRTSVQELIEGAGKWCRGIPRLPNAQKPGTLTTQTEKQCLQAWAGRGWQ